MSSGNRSDWPSLPVADWKETYDTLHMWTQIVGKVRLELAPHVNHWWEVALYVTPRGLTTSPIPFDARSFEIAFDFVDHGLTIETDDGRRRAMALAPRAVADFHQELMELLSALGIDVKIDLEPKEVPDPIPFDQDRAHASYDEASVRQWFRLLRHADRLLKPRRECVTLSPSGVTRPARSVTHFLSRGIGTRPRTGGA